jgi:hypothetical protein
MPSITPDETASSAALVALFFDFVGRHDRAAILPEILRLQPRTVLLELAGSRRPPRGRLPANSFAVAVATAGVVPAALAHTDVNHDLDDLPGNRPSAEP